MQYFKIAKPSYMRLATLYNATTIQTYSLLVRPTQRLHRCRGYVHIDFHVDADVHVDIDVHRDTDLHVVANVYVDTDVHVDSDVQMDTNVHVHTAVHVHVDHRVYPIIHVQAYFHLHPDVRVHTVAYLRIETSSPTTIILLQTNVVAALDYKVLKGQNFKADKIGS